MTPTQGLVAFAAILTFASARQGTSDQAVTPAAVALGPERQPSMV